MHVCTCEHIHAGQTFIYVHTKKVLCCLLESEGLSHRWGRFPKLPCLLFLLSSVYYYCLLFPGSICHRKSIQGQHLTYPQLSIACSQREKTEKRAPLLCCLATQKGVRSLAWHLPAARMSAQSHIFYMPAQCVL